MKSFLVSGALVLLGSTLIACGGGGGGGSLAGGGISGTGSGTVTAFGSIVMNDSGKFNTDDSQVKIDGEDASESDLDIGMVVQLDISGSDDSLATGSADRVRVEHEIKGPVTSLNPLRVLGQTLIVTASSILQESGDPRPANGTVDPAVVSTFTSGDLSLGDQLEVSGRRDDQGLIQVSRLERKEPLVDPLTTWQLLGRIAALNPGTQTFSIGTQPISYASASIEDCTSGLSNGLRVEMKATPVGGFVEGNTLSVTKVECKPDALSFGGSASGSILAEMEGFVRTTNLAAFATTGSGSFTLGDQQVTLSSSTVFEGGTVDDILVGVKLDARGSYDFTTLDANRIRFRETRFRIEAPATALTSTTISTLGMTISVNAKTEDDAGLLASSTPMQVELRGYVESDDSLVADTLKDKSGSRIRVRGRADSDSIGVFTFTLFDGELRVNVANNAELKIEDAIVSSEVFFAALNGNVQVDVDEASFDGDMTLTSAKLEIENN